eukprot:scaffold142793_cov30-Tisochrysis_lutea.AAC.1
MHAEIRVFAVSTRITTALLPLEGEFRRSCRGPLKILPSIYPSFVGPLPCYSSDDHRPSD